jgi:hypothetical protein
VHLVQFALPKMTNQLSVYVTFLDCYLKLLTPIEVTYGQVEGKLGLKAPDFPSLYTPSLH